MTKRMISALLIVCMVIALCPISALAVTGDGNNNTGNNNTGNNTPSPAAGASMSSMVTAAKSFATSQLFSRGMMAAASLLTLAADASGDEGFQQVVSFINKWVFGVNSGGNAALENSIADIQRMCGQILTELGAMEKSMTQRLDNIESMLHQQNEITAHTALTESWSNQVEDHLANYQMDQAIAAYKLYLESATACGENGTDEAKADVRAKQALLFEKFTLMSGKNHENDTTGIDRVTFYKREMFLSDDIDKKMITTIENLLKELAATDGSRYIDRAAQAAFLCFPFSDEQAEFVDLAAERQACQILLALLTYQEFMSMRAEYFLEIDGTAAAAGLELDKIFNSYHTQMTGLVDGTSSSYGGVNKALETWLSSKIYLNSGIISSSYIYLDSYLREKDAGVVTLTNTSHKSTFSSADYAAESEARRVAPSIKEYFDLNAGSVASVTSNASFTSQAMRFYKNALITSNPGGEATVNVFYILDSASLDKSLRHMSSLEGKFQALSGFYYHLPNCDYYNLLRGTFSDGTNTYCALATPDDLRPLLNDSPFSIAGATLYGYFSSRLNDCQEIPLYLLTNSDTSHNSRKYQIGIGNTYTNLPLFEMGANTSQNKQWTPYPDHDEEGEGIEVPTLRDTWYSPLIDQHTIASNAMYTVILTSATDEASRSTVSTIVTGNGTATAVISGNGYSNGMALSGSRLTLTVTPSCTTITSIKVQYPNSERPEEVLFNSDALAQMTYNEDGSLELTVQIPYNDVTFVIETEKNHNFNNDGFCTDCGIYEPATLAEDGYYEISNVGQLYWFAALVNGDHSKAEFTASAQGAKGRITAPLDMSVTTEVWKPIGKLESGAYTGRFDGGLFPITNLNGMLFGTTRRATLKNIAIESGTFSENSAYAVAAGSIAGQMLADSILEHSYSKATMSGIAECDVGGLVGNFDTGRLATCYYAGSITNSWSVDTDTTDAACIDLGGLVGCSHNLTISFSHVYAQIRGGNCIGGLVGRNIDNSGYIAYTYYNRDLCFYAEIGTKMIPSSAYARNTAAFASGEVAYTLNRQVTDDDPIWYQNIDNGETPDPYPHFTKTGNNTVYEVDFAGKSYSNSDSPLALDEEGRYIIATYDDLRYMADMVNSGNEKFVSASYVIVNDIVCDTALWDGIGTDTIQFKGKLDGQGHTISKLNYFIPEDPTVDGRADGTVHGLFLTIGEGAVVEDILLSTIFVYDSNGAGAFARTNYGTITRCAVLNNSKINHLGDEGTVGGLVGTNGASGQILDCAVIDSIILRRKGTSEIAGGLCQVNDGTITNCYTYSILNNADDSSGILVSTGNAPVNSYFYNAFASDWNTTYGIQKDAASFSSGEMVFLLNGDRETPVWKQTLGQMDYPLFTGETVYKVHNCAGKEVYSNTDADLDHVYGDDDICDVCGHDKTPPAVNLAYPTLSLKDEIRYNIYFSLQNIDQTVQDTGLLIWSNPVTDGTIENAEQIIAETSYSSSTGLYKAQSQGIPAKNMGDTIYFQAYAKLSDGSYLYSDIKGYNAILYAESTLRTSSVPELRSLVVALLNYGAAAQVQLEYKTDSLMNAGLTAEQQALVQSYDPSMIKDVRSVDSSKVGNFVLTTSGFGKKYPTVSLKGAFAINYYFAPTLPVDGEMTLYYWTQKDYNAATVLTAENATGSKTMTPSGNTDGTYWANVTGIRAAEIDQTVFACGVYQSGGKTYCTGMIAYSLAAYCKETAKSATGSLQDIAQFTAVYGYYAKIYFQSISN